MPKTPEWRPRPYCLVYLCVASECERFLEARSVIKVKIVPADLLASNRNSLDAATNKGATESESIFPKGISCCSTRTLDLG